MVDTLFGFPRYPKFEPNGQKYPTNSFLGRYLNYCNLIDPRTLFASKANHKLIGSDFWMKSIARLVCWKTIMLVE
ncbi:Tricarboxylate iron carrier domain containing protein [Aphelenchoides besseyi]|nr:Tricarboxylate iron carrier domain containing protein [Aphelenchoides besseyi]KAI6194148.1 Tricarboxylate iron carrier domain containing protein [Aphelenchoides besseyi]